MTAARASASRARRASAPGIDATDAEPGDVKVRTRPEDRWQGVVAPVGRFSGAMGLVLLLSLAVHLLIVGSALVPSPADAVAPQRETPVEIVQETSKPPEPAAAAVAPADLRRDASEQPKVKSALPAERKAAANPPVQPGPARTAERPKAEAPDEKLAALKSELEDLKAQRQALEAERAQSQAAAPTAAQAGGEAAAPVENGLGPLPDSFRAVALPTSAVGADEAVSYQQIVFSQLAKAKGLGGREGRPGSAGVRFTIDEAGRLTSVAVVAPSGIPSLDAEALAIVRKAAPFPPPPPGAQRAFAANVNFTPLAAAPPAR